MSPPAARPWPKELVFDRTARLLRISFEDGREAAIPFETLRVESPSAEVQGHGGAKILVANKEKVGIVDARLVGHYAVRIIFDDGHQTGIYSWDYLHELAHRT